MARQVVAELDPSPPHRDPEYPGEAGARQPETTRAGDYTRFPPLIRDGASVDRPAIRIEISGPRHAGKSVVAAMLKRLLRHHDIAVDGPEKLPHRPREALAAALLNLAARGLAVELVETQIGPSQIDARVGFNLVDRRGIWPGGSE